MASIKDVAKLAGVSAGTVSKYLNTPEKLKEATKNAVAYAIKKLNYSPNLFARNLRVQSSRTIAVIAQEISNPFHATIYNVIRKEALKQNYSVTLYSINDVDGDVNALLRTMPLHYFSGIIICYFHNMDLSYEFAFKNKDIPIVVLNNEIKYEELNSNIQSIFIDFASGIEMVAKHLINQGKKNIAYIGCMTKQNYEEPKLQGFMRAMKAHNLTPHSITRLHKEYSAKTGYESAKQMLKHKTRPDAVLVDNDVMAFGALRFLQDSNISIPKDMLFASFDDIDFSAYFCPALTTVHVPITEVCIKAFNLLMEQINNPNRKKESVHYKTTLVVRETTEGQ